MKVYRREEEKDTLKSQTEHTKAWYSLQFLSSEPSLQSGLPSQSILLGTQSPLMHWNSSWRHSAGK